MLGASFADRGERADEAIAALRAAWSDPRPSFDGRFYSFAGVAVEPCSARPRVPIWVGGYTQRSLRRAVTLADGWMPFGLTIEQLTGMLARFELPDGFEVVLSSGRSIRSRSSRPAVGRTGVREAGATVVNCVLSAQSAGHFCDQLHALRGIAGGIT